MTYAKLKMLLPEALRRYSGVKPETFEAMLEVLEQAEGCKKKAGRRTRPSGSHRISVGHRALPVLASKLGLAEQLLLTLTYWREYRTKFHLASSYGVDETTATRIIGKVEDALVAAGRFKLPTKASDS